MIDNHGKEVLPCTQDEMVIVPDKNTDLFICLSNADYENETFDTKVLNKDGKEILTNYSHIQAIENSDGTDIWYETNILKFEQNGKFGLIDFKGKLILNAEYDDIYALEGIQKNLIIEKDGLKGLVNTSMGEVIVKPEYNEISTLTQTYENGYIVAKDGKYGLISADAKVIFEPTYEKIKNVTANGNYVVTQNGKVSLINNKGETILASGFDDIEEINGENLTIRLTNAFGIIDVTGNTVVASEYEDLKYIYGTYYIAKKAGKYGIISSDRRNDG